MPEIQFAGPFIPSVGSDYEAQDRDWETSIEV